MRVAWTRPAARDLEAIGDTIARDDPKAAARVVARIVDASRRLADHPESGRPGRIPETRELVVSGTPFIVPYRVRGDRVEILGVLHGARRWPEAL